MAPVFPVMTQLRPILHLHRLRRQREMATVPKTQGQQQHGGHGVGELKA